MEVSLVLGRVRSTVSICLTLGLLASRQAAAQRAMSPEVTGSVGGRSLRCSSCQSSQLFVGQIAAWVGLVGSDHGTTLGVRAGGELAWGSPDRHRGFDLSAQLRVPLGPRRSYWIAPSAGATWFRLSAPAKLGALHGAGPRFGVQALGQHQAGNVALRPSIAVAVDLIGSVTFKVSDAFIPPEPPGDPSALYARPTHGYRGTQITVGLGIARGSRRQR